MPALQNHGGKCFFPGTVNKRKERKSVADATTGNLDGGRLCHNAGRSFMNEKRNPLTCMTA